MKKTGARKPLQYAALPFRIADNGSLEVLLVTSRRTRRWLIPKGWPIKGKKPHEAAATEAFEEAGVVGEPGKRRIGRYDYRKRLGRGWVWCDVEVYPLSVSRLKTKWPERDERDRRWVSLKKAAALVEEPGLETIILSARAREVLAAP